MRPKSAASRRTTASGEEIHNNILSNIPDNEFGMLRRYLEFQPISYRQTLQDTHESLKFVYFPNSGLVSLVVTTEDGRSVEVGVVGKEGMVGTPSLVGVPASPLRALVQIPG